MSNAANNGAQNMTALNHAIKNIEAANNSKIIHVDEEYGTFEITFAATAFAFEGIKAAAKGNGYGVFANGAKYVAISGENVATPTDAEIEAELDLTYEEIAANYEVA